MFTAATAAALAGPDWLRDRRVAAAEQFAAAELPSVSEEVWRYSRVADLDLAAWSPATGGDAPSSPAVDNVLDGAAVTVTVLDGAVSISDLPAEWAARGVVVAAASTLDQEAATGLGSVSGGGPDVFATLNDAFALDPIVISVPRGIRLDAPILVTNHIATAGTAVFPRLVVLLAEGAEATVVDHISSGPDAVLSVPLTELDVGRGARLGYLHIQELGPAGWQLGSLVARVGQEADLEAGLVGLGGSYARIRTDCTMAGRGSSGELLAAYFGEGDQTLDFRTFQYHDAPDTTSNLLFKGAVGGHSRSVYTGLIRVDKEARGTNAFQTNRNVKLSETAWAESVPNLGRSHPRRSRRPPPVGRPRRRRRLRDRRQLHPRRLLAERGRGRRRHLSHRVLEARQLVLVGDRRARRLPGHPARARLRGARGRGRRGGHPVRPRRR